MKKKLLIISLLLSLLFCINVDAKTVDPADVDNRVYIIGTHMYTRTPQEGSPYNGALTTEWIMYASRSITSTNVNDMIIYYKNPRGRWLNAITDEDITPPTSFNIEYIDEIKELFAPTLELNWDSELDPEGYNKYSINNEGQIYADVYIENYDEEVDGYEIYDKETDALVVSVQPGQHASLTGTAGVPKTYYAKTFKNYGNTVKRSEKSEDFTLDFNLIVPVPTLVQNTYEGDAYRYDHEGLMATDVHITLPEGATIDGYEVYEVDSDDDPIAVQAGNDAVVTAKLGTTTSYYAKAYKGTGNNKVYSTESEPLELTFRNSAPPVPTLVQNWNSTNDPAGYSKYFFEDGKLSTRVVITLPENTSADGYDVFIGDEKVNSEDVATNGVITLNGTYNTSKTYYAKTYRRYGSATDFVKDYSDASTPLAIDYQLVLPTPTLLQNIPETGEPFYYDSTTGKVATEVYVTFAENTYINNIDGYEVFEQLTPNATPVEALLSDYATVYGELEAPKTFYAKAYKEINGVRVYSGNSSPLSLTFNNATPLQPVLNHVKTNNEYYYYDEYENKMATKVSITVNRVIMDGYDVFDASTNQVVASGDMNDEVIVYGTLGVQKTYYAKTYRLYGSSKHYSSASNTLTFDFRNGVAYTPELSLVWDSTSDPQGYSKYFVDEDGKLAAEVAINVNDEVMQTIDGYDVFDSSDNYVATGEVDEHLGLNGSIDESQTYYAKAFRLYGTAKDYSTKSNNLTIDYHFVLPKPTLELDSNDVDKFYYDEAAEAMATSVRITLPEGVNYGNIDGYEVFNQLLPNEAPVVGILYRSTVVHGEFGQTKNLYAKVYKVVNGKKEYGTNSVSLQLVFKNDAPAAPTLVHQKEGNEYYYYDSVVGKMATKLSITTNSLIVDGYDVFDASTNQVVASGEKNDIVKVNGDLGVNKTFYAKAYRLYGEDKDYSEASSSLTFNFSNGVSYTPVLSLDWNNVDDPNGYTKYYFENGSIRADVSINVTEQIMQTIDGYDIFDSSDNYVATGAADEHIALPGTMNTSKTYYAKAFRLYGTAKDYGAKSNNLTLDYVMVFPTPTLVHDWNNVDDPNGYNKYFYDEDKGMLATDVSITVPQDSLIGGFDGYTVFNSQNQEVAVALSLDEHVIVHGKLNEIETFYAKVYRLNGTTRVYGSSSNQLSFDFKNNFPNLVLKFIETNEPYKYNVVINSEDFDMSDVDGIEFYVKDKNNNLVNMILTRGQYQLIELPFADSNHTKPLDTRLYDIPNANYSIKARPYKNYGDEENYVTNYGNYSTDTDLDTTIPTPVIHTGIENMVCENLLCSLEFYSEPTPEGTFSTNPFVYYYNYVDVFEKSGNPEVDDVLVLEAVPTDGVKVLNNITKGSTHTYYAKAYVMYKGEKLYSENSEEVPVTLLYEPEDLVLVAEPSENSPYEFKISVDNNFSYYLDDEFTKPIIEGIEFAIKVGEDEYEPIELPYFDSNSTKVTDSRLYNIPNTNVTIYARVYQTGLSGEKIYGNYSEEGVEVGRMIPAPTLSVDLPTMDCENGLCYVDFGSGYNESYVFYHDPEDPTNDIYYFDYADLFEQNVTTPALTEIPTAGARRLETGVPKGSVKTYYARAYVMYGNQKVYGPTSATKTVEYIFDVDEPVLAAQQGATPYSYIISLSNKDSYVSGSGALKIEGIEFAIKDEDDNYQALTLPYVEGGSIPTDDHLYAIPNTNTTIYARVYQEGLNNQKIYSDYSEVGVNVGRMIPSPQLGVDLPTMDCVEGLCYVDFGSGIDESYIYYEDPEDVTQNVYLFDNVDLFEENVDTPVLTDIPLGGARRLEIGVPKGSVKTYYARAYVMFGGAKVYGPTSTTKTVEYLFNVDKPVLAVEQGYTPYSYIISLTNKDSYITGGRTLKIEGIEFAIKDEDDNYVPLALPYVEGGSSPVDNHEYAIPNTTTTVYARVYQEGLNNEKIYSDYSEVGVNVGRMIPTPLLGVDLPTLDCENGLCYVDFGSGYDESYVFYQDPEDPTQDVYLFDNVDLFEENVDTPVLTDIPLGGARRLETGVPKGSTKRYYAKAYVMFGNQKIYGPKTSTITVQYLFNVENPVLDVEGSASPYNFRISLTNKDSYVSGSGALKIEGIEFYTKNENEDYVYVNLPYVNGGSIPTDDHIYGIPNTSTKLYARVYQLGLGDQKIYSGYSEIGVSVGNLIPTPNVFPDEGEMVCEDGLCSISFISLPNQSSYFTQNVFYYDYVDVFEEKENAEDEVVLENVPTNGSATLTDVPKGSTKSYYARAYVMYGNQKVYGPKNDTVSVTFLYNPVEPWLDSERITDIPYSYKISVTNQFDYYIDDDGEMLMIDGIDFFTKDENEELHLIELPFYDKNELGMFDDRVYDIPNQRVRIYAKAYQYDDKHEKVYTMLSEEGVEVGDAIPTPRITIDPETVSCNNTTCSVKIDNVVYSGAIFYDDVNNANDLYYYDYVDVFEKKENSEDVLVLEEVPIGENKVLSNIPFAPTHTYYAKAYVMYYDETLDEDLKIYSEPSALTTVSFEAPVPQISFESVDVIAASNASIMDNPGIMLNANTYSVSKVGNAITITDKGMIPYKGGNIDNPEKWAGILVDLGTRVVGTANYTINPEDYSDARRWGAQNDTTFVMWVSKVRDTRTFTFANAEDSSDTISLTVAFDEDMPLVVKSVSTIDVRNADQQTEANIIANDGLYTVQKIDGNMISVVDLGIIPYVGGNISTPKKWVGILVDFGSKVVGTGNYGINEEDYTDARRWGAQTDTTFIMWLTTEQGGTYSFKDADNNVMNLTVLFTER